MKDSHLITINKEFDGTLEEAMIALARAAYEVAKQFELPYVSAYAYVNEENLNIAGVTTRLASDPDNYLNVCYDPAENNEEDEQDV